MTVRFQNSSARNALCGSLAIVVGAFVAITVAPQSGAAKAAPVSGSSCVSREVGKKAKSASGVVLLCRATWQEADAPPVEVPAAAPQPARATAVPTQTAGTGSVNVGKTVWFGDLRVAINSATMAGTTVNVETTITNSGISEKRIGRSIEYAVPRLIDAAGKSVSLSFGGTSFPVDIPTPTTLRGFSAAGFNLSTATLRLGDSGSNTAVVPFGSGEGTGTAAPLRDKLTGSGTMRIQNNPSSAGTVEIIIGRSLIRAVTKSGSKDRFETQIEYIVNGTLDVPKTGVNLTDSHLGLNGQGAVCCTELTTLITSVAAGSKDIRGWARYESGAVPSTGRIVGLENASGEFAYSQIP
jgi:hypothetical protein